MRNGTFGILNRAGLERKSFKRGRNLPKPARGPTLADKSLFSDLELCNILHVTFTRQFAPALGIKTLWISIYSFSRDGEAKFVFSVPVRKGLRLELVDGTSSALFCTPAHFFSKEVFTKIHEPKAFFSADKMQSHTACRSHSADSESVGFFNWILVNDFKFRFGESSRI